jgi:glutathione S-transferase
LLGTDQQALDDASSWAVVQIYDRQTSGNSYKLRLLLTLLGVPYSRVLVPLKDGKNQVALEYLQLNPRGQIPTLVDGSVSLWGSTAGLCYLASTYDPPRAWLPVGIPEFPEVMQWLELAQNEIQTGLFLARAIVRFGYGGDLATAQHQAGIALQTLEWRLSKHSWLVGTRPTIADIACFPYVALAEEGHVSVTHYPGIERWLSAIESLDNFVPMIGPDF